MDYPVVVIADCCHNLCSEGSIDCKRLLSDLLGDQNVTPTKVNCSKDIFDIYPLRLETKYYSSDVGLCVLESPTIGDKKFAESVEAVVLFLSNPAVLEESSFLAIVDPWLSFIQHWEDTSVKLLACTRASSNRTSMQQWCIKNEFELIELDPDEETRLELDDCGEVMGVRRILQALKAHSWTNLEMKDERSMDADRAERLRSYLQESDHNQSNLAMAPEDPVTSLSNNFNQVAIDSSHSASGTSSLSKHDSSSATVSKLHSNIDELCKNSLLLDDEAAFAETGGVDPGCGGVSFEELFGRFAEMKEKADSLPPDQRKAYAENITMAFWRAIGGDEGEIAGIGDSSDDDNDNQDKSK